MEGVVWVRTVDICLYMRILLSIVHIVTYLGFWSDSGYNRAQELPLSFCLSSPGKTGCFRLQMCPYLELKVLLNQKKLIAAVDSDVKISLDLTPPLT